MKGDTFLKLECEIDNKTSLFTHKSKPAFAAFNDDEENRKVIIETICLAIENCLSYQNNSQSSDRISYVSYKCSELCYLIIKKIFLEISHIREFQYDFFNIESASFYRKNEYDDFEKKPNEDGKLYRRLRSGGSSILSSVKLERFGESILFIFSFPCKTFIRVGEGETRLTKKYIDMGDPLGKLPLFLEMQTIPKVSLFGKDINIFAKKIQLDKESLRKIKIVSATMHLNSDKTKDGEDVEFVTNLNKSV